MRLSIVTVCFNSEKTIQKCIESVLNAAENNFEYIIIDGKSSDLTLEIANSYVLPFRDKGIEYKIISEEDTGIYNAMNKAVLVAQGDWILFLNSDDYLYDKNSLTELMSNSELDRYDVVYGDILVSFDNQLMLQKPRDLKRLKSGIEMPFCHQATFTKASVLRRFGFDEKYIIISDIDSFLRMYEAGLDFFYIPKIIAVFSNDGLSQTHRIESIYEGKVLLKSHNCYSLDRILDLNLRLLWYKIKKIVPYRLIKILRK